MTLRLPQRIISLTPTTTEIAFALGLEDKLVGVTPFCDYPIKAKNTPTVGPVFKPDFNIVACLKPDLVIAQGDHFKAISRKLGGD